MSSELNDSVALMVALSVLGQFNRKDFAKWLEELRNILLRHVLEGASKATHVNAIVLFSLDGLGASVRCEGIRNSATIVLVFVFTDYSFSVLFGLGRLNHDCLSQELLARETHRH